jgi:hypothetical protein
MDKMAGSDDQRPSYIHPGSWNCWPGMPSVALIRDLHTYIYLVGVLTRDGSLCRNRRSPFSAYPHPWRGSF